MSNLMVGPVSTSLPAQHLALWTLESQGSDRLRSFRGFGDGQNTVKVFTSQSSQQDMITTTTLKEFFLYCCYSCLYKLVLLLVATGQILLCPGTSVDAKYWKSGTDRVKPMAFCYAFDDFWNWFNGYSTVKARIRCQLLKC